LKTQTAEIVRNLKVDNRCPLEQEVIEMSVGKGKSDFDERDVSFVKSTQGRPQDFLQGVSHGRKNQLPRVA